MKLVFELAALNSIYISTGRIGGFTYIYSVYIYRTICRCGEMKRADRLSTSLNMFSFHVDRTRTKLKRLEKMGAIAFSGTFYLSK